MNVTEDKKVEILLSALTERYSAIHIVRGRLQNLGIWTLGILFTASGWLFQSEVYFHKHEQAVLLIVLAVLVYFLFQTYIKDLEKGFKGQQRTAADIENALGFYTEGFYVEKFMYPLSWRDAGLDNGEGKYFDTNRKLILLGALLLALTILSKGDILF